MRLRVIKYATCRYGWCLDGHCDACPGSVVGLPDCQHKCHAQAVTEAVRGSTSWDDVKARRTEQGSVETLLLAAIILAGFCVALIWLGVFEVWS